MGAAGTRHSLRPLFEGQRSSNNSGVFAHRECGGACIQMFEN